MRISWPALFVSVALACVASCKSKDKDKEAAPVDKGTAPAGAATAPGDPVTPAAATGGGGGGAAPAGVPQKDGADGLKAWFAASHKNCDGKAYAAGKAQTMSAIPTREHLRKIFKDEVQDATIDKLMEFYKELPPGEDKAACIFTPGQGRTEITVHTSTVEELLAYKEGTPAFNEFPGGIRDLAEKAFKPNQTFYEVEVTEPGKDSGTKYHLFFWDGQQWRMLGPVWRAFK